LIPQRRQVIDDRVDGPLAVVAVAQVGLLRVDVGRPAIRVGLPGVDTTKAAAPEEAAAD
jgi:hypothetical protein